MTTIPALPSLSLAALAQLVERLPTAIVVMDDDGMLAGASRPATELLDLPLDPTGLELAPLVARASSEVTLGERSTIDSGDGVHHLVALETTVVPPKDVAALAGAVAHDFNNLLGVIMNFTTLAAATIPPGSAAAADLREVLAASQRAATIAQRLQELGAPRGSRPGGGR